MNGSTLVLMYGAAFVTAVISGSIGAVGGVLLLALMSLALPYSVVIPVHALVQLSSNTSRVLMLRRDIHLPTIIAFAVGLPLGSYGAYGLLSVLKDPSWCQLLIAALLFYVALKPKRMPDFTLNAGGYFLLGLVAGLLGPLLGATGPLLVSFFVRRDWAKETIVATQAACQSLVHLAKLPVFWALDFPYQQHLPLLAGMMVAVVIGTKVGTSALRSMKAEHFMVLLRASMVLIGARLVYTVLAGS